MSQQSLSAYLLLGTLVVFLSGAAQGQVHSLLTGTVTDQSDGAISGAKLSLANIATGIAYSAESNETGIYLFPAVGQGEYELTCQYPGFKTLLRKGLTLETGFARTVDLVLELGELAETMTVEAGSPLLETENGTFGQFIERAIVENMPMESRRAGSLARLTGGTRYYQEGGLDQRPSLSLASGYTAGYSAMWHLDGGTVRAAELEIPFLILNPPLESVQEFRVAVNGYQAEFGRSGNGHVWMTTRSGTNQFHGALYEYFRNDALDARSFFDPGKAPVRDNTFGGSFGGPLVRNRTFFFFNYEGARKRDPAVIANQEIPHPPEIEGDFSNRADLTVTDPLSEQPFPNNVIPASRIDSIGQGFARFYPKPNRPNNDITAAPLDNYSVSVSDGLTQDSITARLDHLLNETNHVYGRFSHFRATATSASIFPDPAADFRAGLSRVPTTNFLAAWSHQRPGGSVLELRYTLALRGSFQETAGAGSGINGQLGFSGVDPDGMAHIRLAGLRAVGSGGGASTIEESTTHQLIHSATWVKGRHSLKAGFQFKYTQDANEPNHLGAGDIVFIPRATGSSVASLLLGRAAFGLVGDLASVNPRTDYWATFLQDGWKLTRRLTLNLGIRWEMDTPLWERHNRLSGFDPKAINPVSGSPGIITFAGLDGQGKFAHDFDTNNFAPRFGFAYRLRPDLVIRGAYGVNYDRLYHAGQNGQLAFPFGTVGFFFSPDGGLTPAFLLRDGVPPLEREPLGPGFGAVPLGERPRTPHFFFEQNHATAYTQHWNLTLQKLLLQNMLVEVGYLANVGHKLNGGFGGDLNVSPLVDGMGPEQTDPLQRPFPQFSLLGLQAPPWGNSSYHAMNMKLERRFSGGLGLLANYTWSRSIDDARSVHPELRHLDKALSGSHVPHRFVAGIVYETPFGHGRRWPIKNRVLDRLAGGWGLGLIAEFHSTMAIGTFEEIVNLTNTFARGVRPNLLRDPTIHGSRTRGEKIEQFFDTSAFEAPPERVFGNSPPTLGNGPAFTAIDLSIHKNWMFQDRYNLRLRAEFFNLPNVPNFRGPETLRGRPDFGRLQSARQGRHIQFGLRFQF